MNEFGKRLKEARKKAKLTQQQISMMINIPRSNISKYENGNLEPNLQTLKELIIKYKTTANYLLEIENERNKTEDENILEIWHNLSEREKGQFEYLYKEILKDREQNKNTNAG